MMVYRRKGRPGFTFQARTQTGWEQVGVGDTGKSLALRIESMWETLASQHRAWDLLNPVLTSGRFRPTRVRALYDLWTETKGDVNAMRRRMQDVDVEPLVNEYLGVYAQRGFRETTVEYVGKHLRYLLPEGTPTLASSLTEDALTTALYAYRDKHGNPVSSGMLRKVHGSWAGFFDYLVRPKRLYDVTPMLHVVRPEANAQAVHFYDLETVRRIVENQPDAKRRALMALMYGAGLEAAVIVGIKSRRKPLPPMTRSAFEPASHEVRAPGTKTHTRDRIARIADWAWPIVWEYVQALTPHAPLAPHDRSTLGDWHREIVKALKIQPVYPLHAARHHWAVRMLRAGTPVGVVQLQLGHATAKLTLDTYGVFAPSGADRAKWEQQATEADSGTRSAKHSAKNTNGADAGAERVG